MYPNIHFRKNPASSEVRRDMDVVGHMIESYDARMAS